MDNASAHRNERIKALVNKHNNSLYAVPYQHFTNSIENYFSMLKSRLQKLDGLKYENLKENIQKVISEIPKEKYENIFKGACERPEKYVPKNKTRKIKKNYKWFLYGLDYIKIGVWNVKRCNVIFRKSFICFVLII